MNKTIAIVAAVAAIAGPASAAEVRINLIGKDDVALRTEVVRAALTVCKEQGHDSLALYFQRRCIADTIKQTEAKIAEARIARTEPAEQLAAR